MYPNPVTEMDQNGPVRCQNSSNLLAMHTTDHLDSPSNYYLPQSQFYEVAKKILPPLSVSTTKTMVLKYKHSSYICS